MPCTGFQHTPWAAWARRSRARWQHFAYNRFNVSAVRGPALGSYKPKVERGVPCDRGHEQAAAGG
ncbi:hypothetical protein D9M68_1008430 [compost metagenome]